MTPYSGGTYIIPAILAILAALTLLWLPLPALLLGVWALFAAVAGSIFAPLPDMRSRLPSQMIIANRAIEPRDTDRPGSPGRRVVLLAPLDTPPQRRGITNLTGPTRSAALMRLALLAFPTLAAALTLWRPNLASFLVAPSILAQLPILIAASIKPALSAPGDGGTGALAAVITATQRLSGLQHVELWAVGVGGAYADRAGVEFLVRRFPFNPTETLAIAVQRLDQGQLSYTTRTGALGTYPSAEYLLNLAADADAADSTIDAEPRPYYADDDLSLPLQRRSVPSLVILSIPETEPNPAQSPADPALVERAARLIVGIVRRLDEAAARTG